MRNEAIKYTAGEGRRPPLAIFPLNGKVPLTSHGCKDATTDREQVERWWNDHPSANIGLSTGELNHLLVIDVDQKPDQGKFGEDSLKDLEKELGKLPETWEVITGSGGRHIYFKYPSGHDIRNSASQLAPDIDVRAQGGYVVAPPSIHPETGQPYEWDCGRDPTETELADLPQKWLQKLENKADGETVGDSQKKPFCVPETVSEGARNDTVFRYGASLRAKAVPAMRTLELLRQFNMEKCSPPLQAAEIQKIYDSVMRYPAGSPENEIMAQVFKVSTGDLSQFHHFNKQGVPTSVYDLRILEYLSQKENIFILGGVPYMYEHGVYIADLSGASLKTAIRKLIYPELIRSTTIDRVFRLFLSDRDLQITSEELNSYPKHWINFRNGFYDPIARKMVPHDPKYRAINQIPHEFYPDAQLSGEETEKWLRFIAPEPDDREMLLQFCGYCLTRDTRQQKFLIIRGEGGSGKSTVIRMLDIMVGAQNISNVSLKELSQRFASYGLMGKLVNSCADLEVTALEDTSTLKKILGEDSIRSESKGKDAISFRSYAKLLFSTNDLPIVKNEKTNGFYRRLMILNMNRIPEDKRMDYHEVLSTEVDYLIQLSVTALERMYEAGVICESRASTEAVQALRCDSDSVSAFLRDQTERVPDSVTNRIKKADLFRSYADYCQDMGRQSHKKQDFYRDMKVKGFSEIRTNGVDYFKGIKYRENFPKYSPKISLNDWNSLRNGSVSFG